MPRDKDRKRIIRERMKKTGESYTAARAHVLSKKTKTAERPAAPVRDLGALAGMTDAAVAAKTGRTWRQWVDALDADGAASMTHRDIAAMLHSKHHVGDWWAQTVTVGYERIKGLRERGQRRNGTYEATKSRTYNVPVAALFDAWADHAARRRWLDGVEPVVRTATKPKSMRLRWPDGTLVVVGFTAKGRSKSAVALAHMQLRDRAASATSKVYWAERLDALGALLVTTANR
jgi:Domain of unknown function (DUF4287)